MNDDLCGKFDYLRKHFSDELRGKAAIELEEISNYNNYCPNKDCNSELEKITIGFLWLLGEWYSTTTNTSYNNDNTNAFFLHIILWLSYKLNQISEKSITKINEFYSKHVKNSDKFSKFISDSGRYTDLEKFIDEQKDLLDINIEDLSKFYDASKLICSMYGNDVKNIDNKTRSNDANSFFNEYKKLNNGYNIEDTIRSKILPILSTDYNKLKNKHKEFPQLPEITAHISALRSGDTSSSSSIGNKLFTVLSIFGAIAFFLGISYKYSLFGFRKRFQKQKLREKKLSVRNFYVVGPIFGLGLSIISLFNFL
ncbi:hypothetical protein YYC_00019 [Plasmodium yoelii 17X]|uniref:Uncharacterized protein n=1 Tax=Plasmodium yoelii 17X TaxID=1323249 RepID=V7PY32_PLAYE|nr:hypothetical protein YYC_00019 [Plasmodium yoelii 17X]